MTANLWLGVSCGTQASADKLIPDLLACPAAVRFLSCEPLLEDLNFMDIPYKQSYIHALTGKVKSLDFGDSQGNKIDWVIVGGESGHGARPMHPDWVRIIRDQCAGAGVPFFFKQWGEWLPVCQNSDYESIYVAKEIDGFNYCKVGKKKAGWILDGVEYNEMPKP